MSDIFPSLAAGTARPTGTSPAGQVAGETAVRVVDPSPELARLATGDSLRGTVVGRDEHGHLQVRTRIGVLTLAVPRPLPVGTEVVLQVRSIGPQVILNLLPLDGAAVQPGQAAPAPGGATAAPPPGTPLPASPLPASPLPATQGDLVQRSQLLRAVLHAAPPLPALAGLPTAQPGTELLVRILSLGLQPPPAAGTPGAPTSGALGPASGGALATGAPGAPTTSGTVAGSAGAGRAPPAGNATVAAPATGTAAQPAMPQPAVTGALQPMPSTAEVVAGLRLAPQTPVAASGHSLAAVLQGSTSEAAAKALGSPAAGVAGGAATTMTTTVAPAATTGTLRLTGQITAATSSGQPILHTPLGTLTLDTRAALPLGTSLALEIALPSPSAASTPALAAAWPSLTGLEEALFQGLPAAQAEAVARALPQVGPRLASGVLFFLSALNQGGVAGWLAQAAANGERGDLPSSLAERLGREFAALARSIETPSGEWRFVNLPLWSDQGLRELRCFFRHPEHGGQRGGDGDQATRFVLELELTRHGELQLDGLVRARRFDLVLRSRRALPALVRGDLLALFEETNAIAGYSGRLVFQASQDWLQLLAARAGARPDDGFRA